MHDRLNNWLCTVMFVTGITCFALLGAHIVIATRAIKAALAEPEEEPMPANAILNPGPYPDEQRSWADLFAACRFSDAWLGSDLNGNPICYPMGQSARVVP